LRWSSVPCSGADWLSAEQACGEIVVQAESKRALKRGPVFNTLAARVDPVPFLPRREGLRL
jgi:hypothetical protein